jgi:uncharacterized protein
VSGWIILSCRTCQIKKAKIMPLSEQEVTMLETILFDEAVEEDTLDYFGLHGLVCAFSVGPVSIKAEELIPVVFEHSADKLDQSALDTFERLVAKMLHELQDQLTASESLELPFMLEEDAYSDSLKNWCTGFVEGFLFHEDIWFQNSQEVVAELLLPVMALSGLFQDDDFEAIVNNNKLMMQFEEQIPELLTDLFLFFHASEQA